VEYVNALPFYFKSKAGLFADPPNQWENASLYSSQKKGQPLPIDV